MRLEDIKNFELRDFIKNNFRIGTPVDAVKASLTNGSGDSEITFTSFFAGTQGNSISVSILDSGEDDSDLSFTFDIPTKSLIIYPKKESGSITSTCDEVADALNANPTVSAYLDIVGGSGVISTSTEANLSGGINGTEGFAKITRYIQGDVIYFCFDDADILSTGKWKKINHLSYESILDYDDILDYDEIL